MGAGELMEIICVLWVVRGVGVPDATSELDVVVVVNETSDAPPSVAVPSMTRTASL